jgi:hypothetical protein
MTQLLLTDDPGDARKPQTRPDGSPLWDHEIDGPSIRTISRSYLLKRLALAAQLRAAITMLSQVLAMFFASAVFQATGIRSERGAAALLLLSVVGGCALASWACTKKICLPFVKCPSCGNSLWSCGSGNFKPRRMRIKKDVHGCPHCGIPFSE